MSLRSRVARIDSTRCNCGNTVCRLDTLNHLLRIHWRWLCDRHDAYIWKRAGL